MADENQGSTAKKPMNTKLLGLIFAVVNIAFMVAGSFVVYKYTLGYEDKAVSEMELDKELNDFKKTIRDESVFYAMDTLTTNFEGLPRRMVRVDVALEMLDEEGFEEIVGSNAEARDALMRILNAKTFKQIESVQGKLHLKNEIIAGINQFLSRGVVKNVYFTELIVQ